MHRLKFLFLSVQQFDNNYHNKYKNTNAHIIIYHSSIKIYKLNNKMKRKKFIDMFLYKKKKI
jgi:hypothetical protein